jgi:hypothetical protein
MTVSGGAAGDFSREEGESGFRGGSVMNHGHECSGDAARVGVLDDISAVDNTRDPLVHERLRSFEDFLVADPATAAH